uniref:Histone deacetylase 10 n=1 Tax=Latimeria chalumnae TaxID=7897 RepID=H3B9N9_LATCH
MASGTALIYDKEMTNYKLLWDYPACAIEVPERLSCSIERLKHYTLLERCVQVPVREATEEDILLVHRSEYLEAVKTTTSMDVEELKKFACNYTDVYFHQNIYHSARLALGATLQLVDSVLTEKVGNGMALVRPPGHHSQRSAANGFCVFNNVAIAAEYAKKKYGLNRILIVDWDVHHGQGIQYTFEEDPSVLYFSWHRYEHQRFWPNLRDSDFDAVGNGRGAGFNVNVPWNKVGMGNADYLAAFFHVLLPMAYEFNPELVLVSAGYDSAIGDPEGEMLATPECYSHLTHLLMSLASGKLCIVLEGGYNLRSLSESVCMTVQTLLGDCVPQIVGNLFPCLSAIESIQNVRAAHRQYWNFLKHQGQTPAQPAPTSHVPEKAPRPLVLKTEETGKANGDAKNFDEFMDSHMRKVLLSTPPVRSAAAVSARGDLALERCLQIRASEITKEEAVAFISGIDHECLQDRSILLCLGNLLEVLDKIIKKEVRNSLVVSPAVSVTSAFAVSWSIASGPNRVLLVTVGEMDIPFDIPSDGKILLLQISEKFCSGLKRHYTATQENKSCGDLFYAFFGLLLPLAYEYQPDLVMIALGPNSNIDTTTVSHLISLLQGLGEGRTLVIVQERESELRFVEFVAKMLLGDSAPALGCASVNTHENIMKLERQRQELQQHWKMLQHSGKVPV